MGTELVEALVQKHGSEKVIATDLRIPDSTHGIDFRTLDVLNKQALEQVVENENIRTIYHLAALLSGNAEKDPLFAWKLNMDGLLNVLEVLLPGTFAPPQADLLLVSIRQ